MQRRHWKFAFLFLVPLALYAFIAERNSWRPKTLEYEGGTVTFSPDGKMLAVGGRQGKVRLWDIRTCKLVITFRMVNKEGYLPVAFSRDGHTLATGGDRNLSSAEAYQALSKGTYEDKDIPGDIGIWDISNRKLKGILHAKGNHIFALAFSPRSDILASASGIRSGSVQLWDIKAQKLLRTLDWGLYQWAITFSPDGNLLVSGCEDSEVSLWNPKTGKQIRVLKIPQVSDVFAVKFSNDGYYLAIAGNDGAVRIWERQTGQWLRTLQGHSEPVRSLAFCTDGTLVSASDDKTVRLWDIKTGKVKRLLAGFHARVMSIDTSPDGTTLASADEDGTVKLWRIK